MSNFKYGSGALKEKQHAGNAHRTDRTTQSERAAITERRVFYTRPLGRMGEGRRGQRNKGVFRELEGAQEVARWKAKKKS